MDYVSLGADRVAINDHRPNSLIFTLIERRWEHDSRICRLWSKLGSTDRTKRTAGNDRQYQDVTLVWDRSVFQAANVTIRPHGDWGSFHAAQRADELMARVIWTGSGYLGNISPADFEQRSTEFLEERAAVVAQWVCAGTHVGRLSTDPLRRGDIFVLRVARAVTEGWLEAGRGVAYRVRGPACRAHSF